VPEPYYSDEMVTLYHGRCEEVTEWLAADVLVTDPPYGIGWSQSQIRGAKGDMAEAGIAGDQDTGTRDAALREWGGRPALVFGSMRAPMPDGWLRILVFKKPPLARAVSGHRLPWHSNWEPVFVLGRWPQDAPTRDAVIATRSPVAGGYSGYATRAGHPHAKPLDVMEDLIDACPPGVIADPFAGAGSTLVAARNLGRRVIGVELEEKYCERAALRLSQMVLA
jgi:DNA modification methylase